MKLTSKLKAEITAFMNEYWDSYFRGDIDHWANYLVDDYRNIGGTAEEIWNSKKEILDFTNRIIDQMIGVSEIRNKQVQIIPYDPYFMVHELLDVYIKIEDEWTFYQKFRLSSLIQKIDGQWKVLHQHGSYPDSKTQEGEAFAFDTLKNENLKLQEAIKKRTKELEEKSRELEIEAALERVRAVAMGMNKPDDVLDVCEALFNSLTSLQFFHMRNALINFWDDHRQVLVDYDYSDFAGKQTSHIKYSRHPVFQSFKQKIRSSQDSFAEIEVAGNELKSWVQRRRDDGEYEDVRLQNIGAFYFYFYSIGVGSVGISSFKKLSSEQVVLLRRFRNVFELAYKRYVDISRAEAQAREAQIEAALERIRATTMAMHRSDELLKTSQMLFDQFSLLGQHADQLTIGIMNEPDGVVEVYATLHGKHLPTVFRHPVTEPYVMGKVFNAWKAGKKSMTLELSTKELEAYNSFRNQLVGTEMFATHVPPGEKRIIYASYFSQGMVAFGDKEQPAGETRNILDRFAKVFEQTYTRFLDLQKAEAQGREAQIQLALERVRARSLAMHHTSELQEVVNIVAQQLHNMGMDISGGVIITVNDEVEEDIPLWASSGAADYIQKVVVPCLGRPILTDLREAIKARNNFFVGSYSNEEKREFFEHLFRYEPWQSGTPERKQELLARKGELTRSAAIAQHTSIGVTSHFGKVFSAEENEILKRFGNVFEQAYIRFLDLQKAEAQAREAEIELSLERVRARGMAMHASEELGDLIGTVFSELTRLDLILTRCVIWIIDSKKLNAVWWMANSEDPSHPMSFLIPYHEEPPWIAFINEWKKRTVKWVYDLKGETKKKWDEHLFSKTGLAEMPEFIQNGMRAPERILLSASFNNFGGVNVASLEPLSDEHFDILLRFAKVFDQTYTRFLDLQKAEAQAREAQIEAALERVRSRTMAMHQTAELQEVIHSVHKELLSLHLSIDGGSFVVINDDAGPELRCWGSGGTANTSEEVLVPHFDMPFVQNLVQGIKNGPGFFTEEFSQKEKEKFFTKLFEHKPWSDLSDEQKKETLSGSKGYTRSVAVSKHTSIFIINHHGRKFTEDENDILKRFAKVFEQTYTRFLDLQKAEAHAREAQIEAALERVRSRSMAMHKTDELFEAAELIYKELTLLGITSFNTSYAFVREDEKHDEYYGVNPMDGKIFPFPVIFPQSETPVMSSIMLSWKKGEPFNVIELDEEGVRNHQTYIGKHIHAQLIKNKIDIPFTVEQFVAESPKKAAVYSFNYTSGYLFIIREEKLTKDEEQIVLRFTNAFNQTYTRFLDLQKAEAQARESQIEAALERVRSRTMAMHKSEEVMDVASTLFEELQKLGFTFGASSIIIMDKDSGDAEYWIAGFNQNRFPESYLVKYFQHPYHDALLSAWKRGDRYLIYTLEGEEKKRYDDVLFLNTEYSKIPAQEQHIMRGTESVTFSIAFMKHGALHWGPTPLNEEQKTLLERFTIVFEQSFTRFLDLKQAEAQARESQIEAAVERIRSKALAMHRSEDLHGVVITLKKELMNLNIRGVSAVSMYLEQNDGSIRGLDLSGMTDGEEDDSAFKMDVTFRLEDTDPDLWIRKIWNGTDDYFVIEADEADFKRIIKWLYTIDEKEAAFAEKIILEEGIKKAWLPTVKLEKGKLNIDVLEPPTPEIRFILIKIGAAFDLAYKRYLDLQNAEAQARETQIELGLERVRARAMAMQNSDELKELIGTLSGELKKLYIELDRCFIMIYDQETLGVTWWMSNPEEPLSPMGLFVKYHDHPPHLAYLKAWRERHLKWIYTLEGDEKKHWDEFLFNDTELQQLPDFVIANMRSKEKVYLNASFNNFGCLTLATLELLPDEHFDILLRFAKVFDLTYTRFNDLKQAEAQAMEAKLHLVQIEAEKSRAQAALAELQATQKQLIQSEKMASLGELTAGIAHEIQNPLNFVNNFAEVNEELISELTEEAKAGNDAEVLTLAAAVDDNLKKIIHHGKRADSIVKGMLQHSRSDTGKKELTDINALADEYLRLSYHGLRAKDKSFNAQFETHFDPAVQSIEVVPQEIGRVLLNLFNNAFYAVNAKRNRFAGNPVSNYEPIVSVTTKNVGDKVIISVKDNGNGIPDSIREKIFQPFFTTKPTGEGTGLGLSLAYDAVTKGHNGQLYVKSTAGEGSVFYIELPAN